MPIDFRFNDTLYRLDAVASACRQFGHADALHVAGGEVRIAIDGATSDPSRTSFAILQATFRDAFDAKRRPENSVAALSWPSTDTPLAHSWVFRRADVDDADSATVTLRDASGDEASVRVRPHHGTPIGIAHTTSVDFLLINGGKGATATEQSLARAIVALAQTLESADESDSVLASRAGSTVASSSADDTVRVIPAIDPSEHTIQIDLPSSVLRNQRMRAALSRLNQTDAVHVEPHGDSGVRIRFMPGDPSPSGDLRRRAAEIVHILNPILRRPVESAHDLRGYRTSQPTSATLPSEVDALVASLADADAKTLGIGYVPFRGPGHENLRILNLRGTGACNSDCVFCVEKFDPAHRSMLKADSTREMILAAAGKHDMLFFASGEPTIHPKLFEYVDLAREVGFTHFGMSSHFRTFADPAFARRTLEAGFQYFDISLHAADASAQLAVNPIADEGESLFEALKGVAVLYRLSEALRIPISITHKIVVSRLNTANLYEIFRATFDRGVRHFILQPVRAYNLDEERRALLDLSEAEILPFVNDLVERTSGTGATIKPYGFSRQALFQAEHVEQEQNRLKNAYGRVRGAGRERQLSESTEERPAGAHWIEIQMGDSDRRCSFPLLPGTPILDEALNRGFELPFGCRMGSCGMCCAKLIEGKVDQSSQLFLSDSQREEGFVLLCQALPLSDAKFRMCTTEELDDL